MCRACRAAIGALKADQRARELTAVGATLRQQGETIASDLAGYVAAIGYDATPAGPPCVWKRRPGRQPLHRRPVGVH